ncbi:uncharacterized protein [Henckelia pumila]|uniref:uncharacterized protein n=1 Tax=Henckelia pumila TaxID=405737 RepID=UPI003C6E1331
MNGRDIIVEGVNGRLLNIQNVVGYYDPLQYPLLLPYGTYGWDMNSRNIDGSRLTCLEYYSYILQIRANDSSLFLRGGRLLQQYVVDNYVKIETQRLRWIRTNQQNIRSELYQGLQDCLDGGENIAGNVGRRIVLPSSFAGSPRDMYQRYQDAMTLVQTYGKPDLFITMTCNPNWNEIKEKLLPGQSPQDRPDLITRVFKAKFEEFKKDVVEKGVLGKVLSYSYVIEYQKRGLPHVHMLLIFETNDKLHNPDDFDSVVRAEIPSQTDEPRLYEAVVRHMIHGPCGLLNPRSPCMRDGICKKKFPKPFTSYTTRGNDSYPIYRRREAASVPVSENGQVMVDNVCGGIKCVKYIYKYIHKGPDRVALELRNEHNYDEIQQFVDGRWICAPEALWRIFCFEFSRMYPSVFRQQIHIPNQQSIRFSADEHVSDIIGDDDNSKTMLTEFFTANHDTSLTERYLYRKFPQHYRWVQSQKKWVPRRAYNKVVGRIYVVSPSEVLVFCQPTRVRELWNEFHPYMSEDYGIIEEELAIQISDEDFRSVENLNSQHRAAFDSVVQTYLRKKGKILIAVATSGISATLLPGGRTAHSRLKIPLNPTVETLCNIEKQKDLAELIRHASGVVWDEAPMANRYAFESVNKTFQDIMENMLPFGGKTMIFGGDFRQVLPIVKRGSAREQIAASISRSTFWNNVNVIHLYQNMRSAEDIEFSQLLLRIGDGLQHCVNGDFIKLPDSMVIPWENEHSISQLIDFVFPHMVEHINDANYMVSRAIITPKNADVDKINELLISKFPGEERE